MKVRLNRKIGKVYSFVFSLCGCSIKSLTCWFLGIAFAEQFLSMAVELALFGETFQHWFDSVFLAFLAICYFHFSYALGDFLLDLALNGDKSDD